MDRYEIILGILFVATIFLQTYSAILMILGIGYIYEFRPHHLIYTRLNQKKQNYKGINIQIINVGWIISPFTTRCEGKTYLSQGYLNKIKKSSVLKTILLHERYHQINNKQVNLRKREQQADIYAKNIVGINVFADSFNYIDRNGLISHTIFHDLTHGTVKQRIEYVNNTK